ncbi:NUDIX domain-containing protein [Rhizobium rhizogenes]|uniref:NUDIX hydrolase n=1 Tax=Rhizobium rhizogenes TaxID=359 RepID=UPI001573C912|nr:NUDIX domain-containing protein [Rhizobium rhizogenes]NTF44206.1 NUDIX domain-containing protein [Rhizobium rhizogenes]
MMKNPIDVLDESGLRTGEVLSRSDIHRLGKPHRVVHLYLFDVKGRLLLQRRSLTVDHFPGALTISVLGHVDAGETSMDTAERELEEELGLSRDRVSSRFRFSYRRDAVLSDDYIDRQFNDVYAAWGDFTLSDVAVDNREVAGVSLVEFPEFIAMASDPGSALADVYRDEARDLAYFLSKQFANLDHVTPI